MTSTQAEHIERVSIRIGAAIIAFAQLHLRLGGDLGRFYIDELRAYVTEVVGIVAPASPDRILRDLRQRGRLNYKVIDRGASLYQITEVAA